MQHVKMGTLRNKSIFKNKQIKSYTQVLWFFLKKFVALIHGLMLVSHWLRHHKLAVEFYTEILLSVLSEYYF